MVCNLATSAFYLPRKNGEKIPAIFSGRAIPGPDGQEYVLLPDVAVREACAQSASPPDSQQQNRAQRPGLARWLCHCALVPGPVRSARDTLRRYLVTEGREHSVRSVFAKKAQKSRGSLVWPVLPALGVPTQAGTPDVRQFLRSRSCVATWVRTVQQASHSIRHSSQRGLRKRSIPLERILFDWT
jgi:hypothetical protein